MSNASHKENSLSWIFILLVVVIPGWFLYKFVISEQVALRATPPPRPEIVTRVEWGARSLNLHALEEFGVFDAKTNQEGILYYPGNLSEVLNTIVIHHSATAYGTPNDVQDLHMDGRGFADVAYHFLIDSNGIVYEGREINIRGAHVQGFNTGSVGVVLLGNFNDEQPTESQLGSLHALMDYLRHTYEIRYLAGHKDYPDQSPDGTECPGANLYPLLKDMARSLGMKYGIKGYVLPDWESR